MTEKQLIKIELTIQEFNYLKSLVAFQKFGFVDNDTAHNDYHKKEEKLLKEITKKFVL